MFAKLCEMAIHPTKMQRSLLQFQICVKICILWNVLTASVQRCIFEPRKSISIQLYFLKSLLLLLILKILSFESYWNFPNLNIEIPSKSKRVNVILLAWHLCSFSNNQIKCLTLPENNWPRQIAETYGTCLPLLIWCELSKHFAFCQAMSLIQDPFVG